MANSNIVLIGMPGSGKSKIGKQISKRLGLGFVDLDEFICEREKSTIARIFHEKGEDYFRALESKFMKEFLKLHSHVVVLGAGAVSDAESVETMNKIGESFWIDVELDEIKNRMIRNKSEIEKRPMFSEFLGKDNCEQLVADKINDLYMARRDFYSQAKYQFTTQYAAEDQVAQIFCKRFLDKGETKPQIESSILNAE